MNLGLPAGGFFELLNNESTFERTFRYTAVRACIRSGLFPHINDQVLNSTHKLWREAISRWFTSEADELETKSEKRASHIKMAGSLLWAFNQNEAVALCDEITSENHKEINMFGLENSVVNFNQNLGQLTLAYPTQTNAFIYTAQIFNMVQRGRISHALKENNIISREGINMEEPPMTFHYFRNLCKLMLDENPSKADLYMIFKTMDLYGLKHTDST